MLINSAVNIEFELVFTSIPSNVKPLTKRFS